MTIARMICLGFIAIIAIGTILLIMPFSVTSGTWNDPLVALFTTTSAVCVTGLAVVDTGTYFSFWGQLIIALDVQIGGLGYMIMTTFLILLIGRKFDLKQKLAIQESFDRPFLQGSVNLIRSIAATTLVFELTGVILMFQTFARDYGVGKGLWMAIFHSITAWNNAGFALFKDNLIGYSSSLIINLTITGLIIVGGIGYQVIIETYLWLKTLKKPARFVFSLNFQVAISTTLFLLIVGTSAFFFVEYQNLNTLAPFSFQDKILAAWFQSVTTRTAGFNTLDIGKLTAAGLFITMGFMFVGASPGSTGGGIKTTTFRILANTTRAVLEGKEKVIIYERTVSVSLLLRAVAVVFGSAATVVLSTILIALTNSNPEIELIQILFEVISAFATVGLSTGITAGASHFLIKHKCLD